jgi:hypothetical protein
MSITQLREKPKRVQTAQRKENRCKQQDDTLLTIEELARLTEPGHRKRSAELCRELALKALKAAQS